MRVATGCDFGRLFQFDTGRVAVVRPTRQLTESFGKHTIRHRQSVSV